MSNQESAPETFLSDRYVVTHCAQQGSSSFSAYAYDKENDRGVFLKAQESPEATLRLRREADVLASLDHPQIPKLLDADFDSSAPYIVIEPMHGTEFVTKWLEKYPLPRLAASICLSALQPLQYIHEKGMTHRDVKTANLVKQWSGRVALVDFESVLFANEETTEIVCRNGMNSDICTTQNGRIRGSVEYISPEQVLREPVSPRSDIYSAGIVLYGLLFGKLPFTGREPINVAMQHVSDQIDLVPENNRPIPDKLIAIVDRATQKRPVDRYPSAGEMEEDLEAYLYSA